MTTIAKVLNVYSAVDTEKLLCSVFFPGDFDERINLTENEHAIQASVVSIARGSKVKAHKHLAQNRVTNKTQEVWIIQSGTANISVYDINDKFRCVQKVSIGCIIVLLDGGHSIESLDSNLIFVEIKNGPYRGSYADKLSI